MSVLPLTITFLGTGTSTGVPLIGCNCAVCTSENSKDQRLRSSILVQSAKTTIVVDTTPDFRYQMLRENVRHLDAVLITHAHKDHIGGVDDTRPFQFFSHQPTHVYGSTLSLQGIRHEIPYAFAEKKYPGVPVVVLHEIDRDPFWIGDIQVTPIQVWHHKMPVHGYRFNNFVYITDANRIEPAELEKIKGCKCLVLNALRHEKHISHFTLDEAVEVVHDLQVERAYFTHISHQLGLHDEVNHSLPQGIALAYDRLQIRV